MYRNNFFAYVLAVACFTILTPSLGAAQTAIVKSLMAALRADTEASAHQRSKAATFTSATPRSPLTLLGSVW
jgi:hypothetical protein